MKTVHVVFKTHLDIGFTDLAKNVIDNYNNNYIPRAINTAFEVNKEGEDPKFIWTTGSYLIWQYLKYQPKNKVKKMEEAIKKGYICWHGMAVTFQTEAASLKSIEFSMKLSKELDERFGIKTVSAKMTDVPGHTRSLVSVLAKNDIKFFHVGMNGVSKIPSIPDNFIWKNKDEYIYVSYSKGYGDKVEIDGVDDILLFAHTHDNSGPQSGQLILDEIEKIQKEYKDYKVIASTMNNFVNKLVEAKPNLPILDEEIGDTWIHGIASDPKKMSQYYRLIELSNKWEKENKVDINSDYYTQFQENLMLIPEHTWGMDIKRYFSDYKNYSKEDFIKARKKDKITNADLTFRYQDIKNDTEKEMKFTSHEWEDRSYKLFESSWKEQREYIQKAISLLPKELQQEAKETITPNFKNLKSNKEVKFNTIFKINGYSVKINNNGAINFMEKDNIYYADESNIIGELNYTIFGHDSYEVYRKNYLRNLHISSWAVDFFKPGIELQEKIIFTKYYKPFVMKILKSKNTIEVHLCFDEEATAQFGAPKNVVIQYKFENSLNIKVYLKDKDAIRMPEGIFFKINPKVNNPSRYLIEKLGQYINPLNVVKNGNKLMHSLDSTIKYEAIDKYFVIKALDSKIINLGKIDFLTFDNRIPNLDNGFYFNLLNTTWGTNFTMWYEDDIYSEYEMTFLN